LAAEPCTESRGPQGESAGGNAAGQGAAAGQVESQGQAIGTADYLIAAVCIANDGVLLTRNRKHFERVQGLVLSGVPSE